MENELLTKFRDLKLKYNDLLSSKSKHEARRDQLLSDIKAIQSKYTEYDLSSKEKVTKLLSDMQLSLDEQYNSIIERFDKLNNL